MSIKQKKFDTGLIKGYDFKSGEYGHVPGYNWNGAYTKNMERMSLNYKGKTGTESYFLPVNKLDLSAFLHDLQYFSPSPVARMYADNQYYKKNIKGSKNPTALLSKAFIWSAWAGRTMRELVKLGVSSRFIYEDILTVKDWFKFYKSLWIPTGIKTVESMGAGSIPRYALKGKYLPSALFGRSGYVPQPYRDQLNNLFKKVFGSDLTTARGGAYRKRFIPLVMKTIGLSLMLGSNYAPRPIKGLKKLNKLILNQYTESEEYKNLNKESMKVYDSYLKYLSKVGKFDNDGNFKINDKINENEAERAYIDYYKQSKKYFEWLNTYYKDYPLFSDYVKSTYPDKQKWEIPKLNINELNKVVNPSIKKPKKIILRPNFQVLDPFPLKQKETEETDQDTFILNLPMIKAVEEIKEIKKDDLKQDEEEIKDQRSGIAEEPLKKIVFDFEE